MERRIRRLRPSADDGARRSAPPRPISAAASQGLRPLAERRGVSRARSSTPYVAGLTPDLRIMDLLDAQPEFTKCVLGLSRPAGERGADRERPRHARAAPRDLRCGGEGLRRRSLHHRRDLGRRIELRHHDRRPLGDALDRDARLCRPAAGLFPRGVSVGAGNPRARRRAPRRISRARGPAPSARPSSCRPRSSASRSTSTATAAATWSIPCPI